MRALALLLLALTGGTPPSATAQQLPPKVFELLNRTNARLEFHVLASATEPWTATNDGTLLSGQRATFGCGRTLCIVAMRPSHSALRTWQVSAGGHYSFVVTNGAIQLSAR